MGAVDQPAVELIRGMVGRSFLIVVDGLYLESGSGLPPFQGKPLIEDLFQALVEEPAEHVEVVIGSRP